MAAVCAEEHFAELIRKRPSNRERLMAIDPKEFIKIMGRTGCLFSGYGAVT